MILLFLFWHFLILCASTGRSRRYRRLVPVLLTVTGGYVGYRYVSGGEGLTGDVLSIYEHLPGNAVSRVAGRVSNVQLPVFARKPVFKFYSWLFNCNLSEVADTDLTHYKTVSEFFRRSLKSGVRPISAYSSLVTITCHNISTTEWNIVILTLWTPEVGIPAARYINATARSRYTGFVF